MTQAKTGLDYFCSEKVKAEQQLRYYQCREKIMEHQIPELTSKARVHRSCTRAGMPESFLIASEELLLFTRVQIRQGGGGEVKISPVLFGMKKGQSLMLIKK